MAITGLSKALSLSADVINRNVAVNQIGAYALGYTSDNIFYVQYVGRSDSDLNGRLLQHDGVYSQFMYGYYYSSKAAYEKECRLYHQFTPPDNDIHPARPSGTNHTCPVCGG